MENEQNPENPLSQGLTRRQLIKAGGIAAVGLAFTKPLIDTIYPKPAFAGYIPREPGSEGCTPGYWKNHVGDWIGYAPATAITSVFAIPANFSNIDDNLLAVLGYPEKTGQPEKSAMNLLRHAVAALLNAAHLDVNYPRTEGEIITDVNAALSTEDMTVMETLKGDEDGGGLDGDNNLGCPGSNFD